MDIVNKSGQENLTLTGKYFQGVMIILQKKRRANELVKGKKKKKKSKKKKKKKKGRNKLGRNLYLRQN